MRNRSLQFKLIRGFLLILAPLALFLFYHNYEAMRIVREEVSKSTQTALSLLVSEIDKSLEETGYYLLRLVTTDASYSNLVTLSLYPPDSGDYFLAKQTVLRKLSDDLNSYKIVDTFFAYVKKNDELIATQRSYETTLRNAGLIQEYRKQVTDSSRMQSWQSIRYEDHSYLMRIQMVNPELWVGAIVDAEAMLTPLQHLNFGKDWKAILFGEHTKLLTNTDISSAGLDQIRGLLQQDKGTYRVFKDDTPQRTPYLLVSNSFQSADLELAALVPEREKLQQLPYFQRVVALIPIGAAIVLLFYGYFLRRVLLVPMNALIVGMRKMMNGDFDVRLKVDRSTEMKFLIETFNGMVSQIRNLKIDVYEEKLKAQESEFKHLQAQINPHFYLNSLNVMYSLSVLGENRLVERMAEHLADYFRFITRSHRESIALEEELDHIRNYLDIQALRFPEKLSYRIDAEPTLKSCRVLPLMIQPFVENAVVHGMDKGKQKFHIEIEVRMAPESANAMEIVIADNGKGWDPDVLKRFQSGDFGKGTGRGKLGIWNVNRRLSMKFGAAARLSFENGPERGAIVRIVLPIDNDEALGDGSHV